MHYLYSKKKKILHIFFKYKKKISNKNLTPKNQFLQASIFKFDKDKVIKPHFHLSHKVLQKKRKIQESWLLFRGQAKIYYYDEKKKLLKSFIMKPGDISISFSGGHKLEIQKKNTIIYEFKTGPYKGSIKDLKYF